MTANPREFRLMSGTVSQAEINNTITAILEDFPIQTDMSPHGFQWRRPGNEGDVISKAGLYVDDILSQRRGYGGRELRWPFLGLSPKMIDYLFVTILGSQLSAPVTIKTWDRYVGDFVILNCEAKWPRDEEVTLGLGGAQIFPISLVDGVTAVAGPDLTPAISHTDPVTNAVNEVFSLTVTNNGDGETFAIVQLDLTIPAKMDFVTTAPLTWGVLYSDDNGASYSGTLPTPASNTTDVRYLISTRLGVGASYDTIALTLLPTSTGAESLTGTVATVGDTNAGNDSDTDSFTIV
jgi:hypothetical protein